MIFHLREGVYPAKISKKGYGTITETVAVTNAAVSKDVVLTSTSAPVDSSAPDPAPGNADEEAE